MTFGLGEGLSVMGLAIQLKSVIANIIEALRRGKDKKDAERKTVVEFLSLRLDKIEATLSNLQLPKREEDIIRSNLELMMTEAKQLEKRLNHPKILQLSDVLTKGTFDSHVKKLRSELADIADILKPYQQEEGSSHPQYQVGSPRVQQHPHMPSASTRAPPQVVYNHAETHTTNYNFYAGMGGSIDYGDVAPRLDQANGHKPRIRYLPPTRD